MTSGARRRTANGFPLKTIRDHRLQSDHPLATSLPHSQNSKARAFARLRASPRHVSRGPNAIRASTEAVTRQVTGAFSPTPPSGRTASNQRKYGGKKSMLVQWGLVKAQIIGDIQLGGDGLRCAAGGISAQSGADEGAVHVFRVRARTYAVV